MATFDNFTTIIEQQPWQFLTTFPDAWIAELFNTEKETLNQSLHNSISNSSDGISDSLVTKPESTPAISGCSEYSAPASKQRKNVAPTGRIAKRKSRASKSTATTTFIAADPANFRQMVQQVTGVRFEAFNGAIPVVKPEPRRIVDQLQPVLDTSSFYSVSPFVNQPPASGIQFESVCSFPTLESWKDM